MPLLLEEFRRVALRGSIPTAATDALPGPEVAAVAAPEWGMTVTFGRVIGTRNGNRMWLRMIGPVAGPTPWILMTLWTTTTPRLCSIPFHWRTTSVRPVLASCWFVRILPFGGPTVVPDGR